MCGCNDAIRSVASNTRVFSENVISELPLMN